MKFFSENSASTLEPELDAALQECRTLRGFDVETYIEEKVSLIVEYFNAYGLHTAVVGVSGGIDSAIVLGLLNQALQRPYSPLKRIVALLLPSLNNEGVSGQSSATARAKELCESYGITPHVFESLTEVVNTEASELEKHLGIESSPWARGQLVCYQRTPLLYYAATLCTSQGEPAVVVGTTNLDEGGYLGYIGKASDAMVDIQVISDVHKSEVYKIAQALNVTNAILEVTPTGDMYDERVDEQVFGAPYDFVEIFLFDKMNNGHISKSISSLSQPAQEQWKVLSKNLEDLHRHNHHKYLGGSAAVHLDILPASVPNGWNNKPWSV